MRLSINTLKEIENEFGEFDISQIAGGSNDMYLRFGYWRSVNTEKLQNIIGADITVKENSDYDDDCGNLYMYRLINSIFA